MAEKFEVLSDREHTLLKAHIMVGGLVREPARLYINGALTEVQSVPALQVIIREIIDNSVDEFIRSGGKNATKIDITLDSRSLTVTDNGRGIPVQEYVNADQGIRELQPVLCWTRLRAGTSFVDHAVGPSSNGVGASVANILSIRFKGETWDGSKYCVVSCSENMSKVDVKTRPARGHKTGTRVYLEPDFARFGEQEFSPDEIRTAEERIRALSAVYPEITFTFNGERIRTRRPADYLAPWGRAMVVHTGENYFFGVMPTETEEYFQQSYIDGLYVKNGGTHEAYITAQISYAVRDAVRKRFKIEMMPAEIKRGLLLVFDARYFPNLKFDSQTKERLTNSEAEVRAYLGAVDWAKIAKQIVSTPEIIDPIVEAKLAKQIAAERRQATLMQKALAKKYVEKHIPAKSRNRADTVLFLTEGQSATGQSSRVRDVMTQGFYPMRGCLKNTWGASEKEILENKELNDIMSILGLSFPEFYTFKLGDRSVVFTNNDTVQTPLGEMRPASETIGTKGVKSVTLTNQTIEQYLESIRRGDVAPTMNYGAVGILCDADIDGLGHIATLVVNFLARWRGIFEAGQVFLVTSPRYIFTKNKGKRTEQRVYCYDKAEYEAVRDRYSGGGWELRYIKGLGTLRPAEFKDVLTNRDRWYRIQLDDIRALDVMFGDNVEARREIMGI